MALFKKQDALFAEADEHYKLVSRRKCLNEATKDLEAEAPKRRAELLESMRAYEAMQQFEGPEF